MVENKKKERNWISLSLNSVVLGILMTILYIQMILRIQDILDIRIIFSVVYLIILWALILFYILVNIISEIPKFAIRKHLSKIRDKKVYESWYFLMILGMIFGSAVIAITSRFGEGWGIASFLVFFGFLFAWIRDILQEKRKYLL